MVSARPMIAAFSILAEFAHGRLHLGTIGNMPGWGLAGCWWRRMVTLARERRGRS